MAYQETDYPGGKASGDGTSKTGTEDVLSALPFFGQRNSAQDSDAMLIDWKPTWGAASVIQPKR